MLEAYPPGSTLRWGWNQLDDDTCWVTFEGPERTPEVLALVRATAGEPDRVDVAEAGRQGLA